MIYRDDIRESTYLQLAAERGLCVSLFLPTSRLTQAAQGDRINFRNLAREAMTQAGSRAGKQDVLAMQAQLDKLHDDDDFWAHQAYGLGVFVTPESIRSYRLSYAVDSVAEVSDRFHLKPLVAALRPKSAYVLAISQKSVRFYEFTPARELVQIDVPKMPGDFSEATSRTLQRDRAPARKLEGGEGHKVLQTQFLRAVEKAVRPLVSGSHVPLVLATTTELQAIYRSLNHYELLAERSVDGSVENLPEEELRKSMVPIVRELRQARIDRWVALFHQRESENRAITDLSTIGRLASQGQVSDLLVDADHLQYGTLSDRGDLSLTDTRSPASYDVIAEILARVLKDGGEVLAVRKDEQAPEELLPMAAILRWA